jgi:hypothetical protein
LAIGKPAACQAPMPPWSAFAFVKPRDWNLAA